jgi:hypothetical protein
MVCDAHLFILQIHTNSFGTHWQEEMMQCRGSIMSQSLILIDALPLLVGKRKKKRETARRLFSQGRICLAGFVVRHFLCAAREFFFILDQFRYTFATSLHLCHGLTFGLSSSYLIKTHTFLIN